MSTTEIVIRISDQQYFATLLIDGQINRRTILHKWPQIAVWAHQVRQELGTDIYAHLNNSQGKNMHTTLALARYLDGEGFTVGIKLARRNYSKNPLQLQ